MVGGTRWDGKERISREDAPSRAGMSRTTSTIAFHFRYVMPGQYVCETTVALDRLTRVLRALRGDLVQGTASVRMGQLFYTQDLGSDLESGWWAGIFGMPVVVGATTARAHLDALVPLDRILVVSVSGNVAGKLEDWSRRIEAVAGDRFLFALKPSRGARSHDAVYFGATCPVVGELRDGAVWELTFDAMEYEPALSAALRRLGIERDPSEAEVAAVIERAHRDIKHRVEGGEGGGRL